MVRVGRPWRSAARVGVRGYADTFYQQLKDIHMEGIKEHLENTAKAHTPPSLSTCSLLSPLATTVRDAFGRTIISPLVGFAVD